MNRIYRAVLIRPKKEVNFKGFSTIVALVTKKYGPKIKRRATKYIKAGKKRGIKYFLRKKYVIPHLMRNPELIPGFPLSRE